MKNAAELWLQFTSLIASYNAYLFYVKHGIITVHSTTYKMHESHPKIQYDLY